MSANCRLALYSIAVVAGCSDGAQPLPSPTDAGVSDVSMGDAGAEIDPCPTGALMAPEAELRAMARAQCEKQIACNIPLMNQGTTIESCLAQLRTDDYLASFSGRGTPSARNSCLCRVRYEQSACEEIRRRLPDACGLTIVGAGEIGEACSGPFDCKEGLSCDARAQCPGACAPMISRCTEGSCSAGNFCRVSTGNCEPFATAGAECFGRACSAGYFCGFEAGASVANPPTCVPVPAEGEPCIDAEGSCPDGLTCLGALDPVCAPGLASDEPCSGYSECGVGLFCDFDIGVCRPRAPIGVACRNIARNCGEDLYCDFSDSGECDPDRSCGGGKECCSVGGRSTCVDLGSTCDHYQGVCEPSASYVGPPLRLVGPGDRCDSGDCPLGTVCRTTTVTSTIPRCAPLLAEGEACTTFGVDPYACEVGFCDIFNSGRCVAPKLPGEACSVGPGFTFACGALHCDDGVCADWDAVCRR